MKLRVIDRVLMVVLIFLILAMSLLCLSIAWGAIAQDSILDMMESFYALPNSMIVITVIVAVIIVVCLRLLLVVCTGAGNPKKEYISLKSDENGNVVISLDSIEQMAVKTCTAIEAVSSIHCEVKQLEGAVQAKMKISLKHEAPVLEKSIEIQAKVIDTIKTMTGLPIANVDVVIDNTRLPQAAKKMIGE